eukprot:SAG11_NODE_146_length_14788_cov_5.672884_5_plen_68_part_00
MDVQRRIMCESTVQLRADPFPIPEGRYPEGRHTLSVLRRLTKTLRATTSLSVRFHGLGDQTTRLHSR